MAQESLTQTPPRARPGTAAAAVAAGGVAAAGVVAVLGRSFRASPAERRSSLPGDDLLPHADVQNDRATTIKVPPSQVWPWIAQLGQSKAGFYSFERLENAMGCDIRGVAGINPAWQSVAPEDELRLHPELALRIARVEPQRHLVATSQGGEAPGTPGFSMTWGFYLSGHADGSGTATRLHIRERYLAERPAAHMAIRAVKPLSAVMTWRMLARLRKLAPQAASSGTAATAPPHV
jgi:hypothetical protein